MTPFRLAVHNESHKLLGYWWLRQHETGYALTFRHPISREFKFISADHPEDIVKHFYTTYLGYLDALILGMDNAIKDVPDEDCRRPGFRPNHFRNLRRELVSRRANIICRSRERYAEAVSTLRERGWPPVPPPPCFHMDISRAATSSRSYHL